MPDIEIVNCGNFSFASWINRFILFHGKRHPQNIGKPEIEAFLSNLIEHLVYVKRLRQDDLAQGYGRVYLPNALAKKISEC
jgi:hypothetical protein